MPAATPHPSVRFGLALLLALAGVAGCATNPVTGESQLALVPTSQQIAIGTQQYEPSQQMQGGTYALDPGLTRYVAEVGERLAAKSDADLPYEFEVLNSSVPNAWALPGGKIAINRGLLTELNSEAELAAVLGHEIVHAAAAHGAQAMTRGMIVQGALLATAAAVSVSDYANYSNLAIGAASLGAQLVTQKYGRDAELESDRYGMVYMQRAGYEPSAAVDLQQTFVRLSEGRTSSWVDGLFASHPPSIERVRANRAFAQELGAGGELGVERYRAALSELRRRAPAYDAYDEGRRALANEDAATALSKARAALDIEPREARFHALAGDALAATDRITESIEHYDSAVELEPGYFAHYQARGFALLSLNRMADAQADFERANSLLPTAAGAEALGVIALDGGRRDDARGWFAAAAESGSDVGTRSRTRLARIDLADRPQTLINAGWGLDADGMLVVEVRSAAPIPVEGIVLDLSLRVPDGRVRRQEQPLGGVLAPGEARRVRTGLVPAEGTTRDDVRVGVIRARPAR